MRPSHSRNAVSNSGASNGTPISLNMARRWRTRVILSASVAARTRYSGDTLANYTQRMADHTTTRRGPEPPDLSEKGGNKDGQPQHSNERLFMQFLAFGGCASAEPLANALDRAKISGVLYEDVND